MSNGKLLHGLPIAVDHWRLPKSHDKFKTYLYFLTHLHTDHTQGLTNTWTETIYTSKLNAELAVSMLKVKSSLIRVLEVGASYYLPLPGHYGANEVRTVSVTLIDANHIKGSVMILFEGDFGRILYTGDFRICDSMLRNPKLQMIAESENLDLLYVDNTFEEVGNEFPSREKAMEQVLKIVRDHKYHRIIFGCQTIGKEDVLLRVARELKEPVYVPATILELYKIMGLPIEMCTTNQSDSQLWFEQLRRMTVFDLKTKNQETPTIGIALTASSLLNKSTTVPKNEKLMYTVPYSNHCSASELLRFLRFMKPKKIERIVADSKITGQSVLSIYNLECQAESFDEKEEEQEWVHSAEEMVVEEEKSAPSASPDDDTVFQSKINAVSKADDILNSVCADLDEFDDQVIYSDRFIEKLLSLSQIHQNHQLW